MDLRAACLSVLVFARCNAGVAPPPREMAQDVSQPPTSRPVSGSALHVADLAGPVIGLLGKPLGLVVQLDATIVDGESLREKRYSGRYLLRVEKLASVALAKPVVMEFSSDPELGMPSHNIPLAEWKAGKGRRSLDDRELARIRDGYVGTQVSLHVYETGAFRGVPRDLPPGTPLWADVGFSFQSSLVVLERLK